MKKLFKNSQDVGGYGITYTIHVLLKQGGIEVYMGVVRRAARPILTT
jgi:hypothetical protein